MIEVTPKLKIHERDIQITALRASGPGGQNVNKVSTAIQLRYRVATSNLPDPVKKRLLKIAGKLTTDRGELVILAKRHRSREQNLADGIHRLTQLIRLALREPKRRKASKPSLSSKEARLAAKKKRGELKKFRNKKRELTEN